MESLLADNNNKLQAEFVAIECNIRHSFEERLQGLENNIKNSIRSLTRRVRDIESDQRTTQAIGRAVLDSGVSFKDTRIPYPLQGNAAIEDIKDYY